MRQPQPQNINRLWYGFHPSFDAQPAASLTRACRRVSKTQGSTLDYRSVSSNTRAPVTIIPSHPRNPTFHKAKHILTNDALSGVWGRRGATRKKESLAEAKGRDVQEMTTAELHDTLDCSVEDGNFARINKIVEILVQERGEKPDQCHYQALIAAQASLTNGSAAEIERLLQEMQEGGIEHNAGICSAVLKALAIHPHYLLRQYILNQMETHWYALNTDDHNYIAAGLLKEGQFELAWDHLIMMLNGQHKPEPWLLHLFLYSLSSISAWLELQSLLNSLPADENYRILPPLWSHMLLAAARERYQPLVRDIWNRAVRLKYINPSSGLCTTILESCAVNGDTVTAADVFRVLTDRSTPLQIWHYESLIETYLNSKDIEGVISTIKIMIKAGFPLTEATTRAMFSGLRDEPEMLQDALGIMFSGQSTEVPFPLVFANTILEALIQQDGLSIAIDTLPSIEQCIPEPLDVSTFNILLQGCSTGSTKDTAMRLASEMRTRKIIPNALTYDRLILACLASGEPNDFEDAWKYYNECEAMMPPAGTQAAINWGIRRGTIKILAQQAVLFQDRRIFTLLDKCAENGIHIDDIRRDLDDAWNEAWDTGNNPTSGYPFESFDIKITNNQTEDHSRL